VIDLTGRWTLWPDAPLRLWRAAMRRALSDVDPTLRAPLTGDGLLREELAALTGTPAGRITVTAGVRAAAVGLLGREREVVVERPTYLGVPRALAGAGVRVRLAAWEQLAAAGAPVWLTSPARNPDGRGAGPALLSRLAAAGPVYLNSAYDWYAEPAEPPPGVRVVGTLHKLAGPGACLGWVRGELAEHTVAALSLTAPPQHWQRAWGYFLRAGGLSVLRAAQPDVIAARAAFLVAAGRSATGQGPNVLIELPGGAVPGWSAYAVAELALAGVLASPGEAFAAPGQVRCCLLGVPVEQAGRAGSAVADLLARLGRQVSPDPAPAAAGAPV
jgi:DNA-binding transcriptional MocR family regulator